MAIDASKDSGSTGALKVMVIGVDFGFPAEKVRNFIRGLSTRPGAYTYFRDRRIKIYAAEIVQEAVEPDLRPGKILPHRKKLLVQCDNSAIEITRLVPEGKKEMDGVSFVNGLQPKAGEVLGETGQRVEK